MIMHARTQLLIGTQGLATLRAKTVMIAGLGGVGGFAAEAIARSGVGRLILVDYDCVTVSNLNRQLLALHSTLGRKKTAVMQARIHDISPDVAVIVKDVFIQSDNVAELCSETKVDYVLDCIDSLTSKAVLVKTAQEQNIPVISALGAGNCWDVTRVKTTYLDQTAVCPLARALRQKMKKLGGNLHYPVVFSDELRRQKTVSEEQERANGTISYLPALFGIMMAGYAVRQLLEPA